MSTRVLKTTNTRGIFYKIIERLKIFTDDLIKKGQKNPVKRAPVRDTMPRIKLATKKTVVNEKTTIVRKTKPKIGYLQTKRNNGITA